MLGLAPSRLKGRQLSDVEYNCILFWIVEEKDEESFFFDLELEMENNVCRDLISTSPEDERRKYDPSADEDIVSFP